MSEETTFYRRERPKLIALGITNYDDQSRELERRWKAIVDARARSVQRQKQMIYAQQPLTDSQCRATNMRFVHMDASNGTLMFVYTIVPKPTPARPVPLQQSKRARPTPSSGLGELLTSLKKDTLQQIAEDLDLPVSGNKETLYDRIMTCQPHKSRMLDALNKSTLQMMAGDLDISTSGNKSALHDRIIAA